MSFLYKTVSLKSLLATQLPNDIRTLGRGSPISAVEFVGPGLDVAAGAASFEGLPFFALFFVLVMVS